MVGVFLVTQIIGSKENVTWAANSPTLNIALPIQCNTGSLIYEINGGFNVCFPGQFQVTLGSPGAQWNGQHRLVITDFAGFVRTNREPGARYQITVSDLPPGVYMLQVLQGDGTASVHKIIKQ